MTRSPPQLDNPAHLHPHLGEDDDALFAQQVAGTSEEVVVQSLRRRLWRALEKEDPVAALKCYQATRSDWEHMLMYERRELQQKNQALQNNKRKSLRNVFQRSASRKNNNNALSQEGTTPPKEETSSTQEGALLPRHMNPSESFQPDDYKDPYASYEEKVEQPKKRPVRRRIRVDTVRQAFSLRHRRNSMATAGLSVDQSASHETEEEEEEEVLRYMTTPLHEVARLGDSQLLQCLLVHCKADCNVRNGVGRTALHCVAGGLTKKEARWSIVRDGEYEQPIGIGIPRPPLEVFGDANEKQSAVAKAARVVGRLFRECKPVEQHDGIHSTNILDSDEDQIMGKDCLDFERTKAAAAILEWSQPSHMSESGNNNDLSVSQGVHTNAVDAIMGRTALHYAAELGRGDLCEAILRAYFGTMLTVIDRHGRTPCELAAEQKADKLAAGLEARALLYIDPYGSDEEIMEVVTANDPDRLVPPFDLFQTLTMDSVRQKREHRISQAMGKMEQIIEALRERENTQKIIKAHAEQSLDESRTEKSVEATLSAEERPSEEAAGGTQTANDKESGLFSDSFSVETASTGGTVLHDSISFESLHQGHVESFLRSHNFDVKKALKLFSENPVKAFKEADIALPLRKTDLKVAEPRLCLICCETFDENPDRWCNLTNCSHGFCADCMAEYLSQCSTSKSTGLVVPCPHHNCAALLSLSEIAELAASEETDRALLNTANEQFVVDAHDFKFCPHPGCTGVVKFHAPNFTKDTLDILQLTGAVCTADPKQVSKYATGGLDATTPAAITYEGVLDTRYHDLLSPEQPRKAHRFCFLCSESMHWPVTCERLAKWKETVANKLNDVNAVSGGDSERCDNFDDVAQKLWMKANTRPCPKCKAPIQKNEGENVLLCETFCVAFELALSLTHYIVSRCCPRTSRRL